MRKYEKIDTLYIRDTTGTKKLIEGKFRDPTVEFLAPCEWIWTEKVDGCLRSNTKLLQTNGEYITIKDAVDAKLPIEIYGYKDGKVVPTKVLAFHNNGNSDEWYKIKFSRRGLGTKGNSYSTIETTANHKFFINGNYKRADELKVGDKVTYMREERLLTFIAPYICDCMQYKLSPEFQNKFIGNLFPGINETLNKTFEMEILDIEIKHENHFRYDLTTETHNYFANGVLVHNCNIRVYWDGHTVTFGGRTDNASIPAELVTRLNELFGGESNAQMFEQMFGEKEVILFGEGYGRKIQKGGGNYIPDGVDFILFDVLVGDNYLERANVEDIAKAMGIKVVPIIGSGSLFDAAEYVKIPRKSVVAEGRCDMEGLVCRPKIEMRDRRGNRLIVKVKYCDMKELV